MNIDKKFEREFIRKMERKLYQTVSTNYMYEKFKSELISHFNSHNFSVPFTNISVYPEIVTEERFYVNNKISKKNNVEVSIKMSENTIKIFHEDLCNITIIPHPNGIELYRLEMYNTNKGYGSIFMNIFTDISKRFNIPIILTIGSPGTYTDNSDRPAQIRFYKRFGFKRCKNSDYYSNEK